MENNRALFDSSNEQVLIAGYPLSFWTKKFSLPIHIYFAPQIRRNLRAFKEVLSLYYPKSRVCFAAKACTHPLVLRIAKEEGCGSDVASYNEVKCALEAGIPPQMLDLNGNCKEDFLIEEAINKNMNIIADSIEEYENLQRIAAKLKKKTKALLRISGYELESMTDDSVFTAGVWTKFGTQISEAPGFIKTIYKYPNVELVGFHTHIGSQIAKVDPYISVMGKLIELAHLLNESGGRCEELNIGGGFPVSYVDKKTWEYIVSRVKEGYLRSTQDDLSRVFVWHDSLAGFYGEGDQKIHLNRWTGEKFYTEYPKEKMLEKLLTSEVVVRGKKLRAVAALKQAGEPTLTIEPGRSVVEDSGVTLAKVGIVKKVAHYHNLVNLEMGVTSHGESLIEKPVKRWEIANDYHKKSPEPFEAFIGGNLCFSGDMISKYKVFLQRKPKRGDVLVIHDTGAYTSSLLSANSNSFPRPARIFVDDRGRIKFIKKPESYREIIQR